MQLIFILAAFIKSLMKYISDCVIFSESSLINSQNLLQSCKNRMCHHKFKLDAWNDGWTKKEAKIFIRISLIFRILHWLDWNRKLRPKDMYYITTKTRRDINFQVSDVVGFCRRLSFWRKHAFLHLFTFWVNSSTGPLSLAYALGLVCMIYK